MRASERGVSLAELAVVLVILGALVVVFLNLFALFYLITRGLFLKETGRKLAVVEKQLRTGDTIVRDLSERLAGED